MKNNPSRRSFEGQASNLQFRIQIILIKSCFFGIILVPFLNRINCTL
ncbi:hypothetical protein T01_2761 [Trichinella spiralis]|uniref:Uncharacterized protein n=1 Tax=Trichinella spiralis TaxID=6334 RepID=A0A0V1AI50_TRISP|nr:hypothetical protein T01_2761 [Trichinella spiralis]